MRGFQDTEQNVNLLTIIHFEDVVRNGIENTLTDPQNIWGSPSDSPASQSA